MAAIKTIPLLVMMLLIAMITGCASNQDLMAEYGPLSCPVETVVVESEVAVERDAYFRYNMDKLDWRQSVYFASGQSRLRGPDETQVAVNIKTLNRYPIFNVLIKGFTDSVGSTEFNAKLSMRRVLSVSELLKEKGIQGGRIYISALGEQAPLNGDLTAADRAVNRRVDMVLLGPNETDDFETLAEFLGETVTPDVNATSVGSTSATPADNQLQ
ncbi:Outer membrane porin F [BD1-7 clade bacterium]|uniref:Outer membrane porin F n=1 Tax=BD1-7 clade bacterium TaxID=2029982 RepID=A0A5S9PSK4_9GAMM|nr:Outer membrane porin F [BD1-7 clade bacterium]